MVRRRRRIEGPGAVLLPIVKADPNVLPPPAVIGPPDPRYSHGHARLGGRYWPTGVEPPRLEDGTVDIRALCRFWDDEYNQTIAEAP